MRKPRRTQIGLDAQRDFNGPWITCDIGDFTTPISRKLYNLDAMYRHIRVMTAVFTMIAVGILSAQSRHNNTPYPQFSDMSKEDAVRLDQQRVVVANAAKQRYGTASLTRTKADLPVLQKLIDDKAFSKAQTYELQCLGVAFGDVLANELPLQWVMISDEYGTDPTLRFKKTSWNVNALMMISKRIEKDEPVNVSQLLGTTREYLSKIENNQIGH